MNALFISKDGDSLSIARRVEREGHVAKMYIHDKKARNVGNGLISKIDVSLMDEKGKPNKTNISNIVRKVEPDVVVFDMVKLGDTADYFKSLGLAVFGGCKWADHAELNREYGSKLMTAAGIGIPKTKMFKSGQTEDAIKFVRKSKETYVYKPSGNIEVAHTYVSQGPEDLIAVLDMWKDDKADFELQEYISGVEVSCEMWWNGFTSHLLNWTMEEKKLMNDGIGPATGCMGNVVARCNRTSRLFKEGVKKMERLLKKTTYRGPIDLNSIVTKDKLYGLEFTVRMGYDAVQALLELYKSSISRLLFDVASGNKPREDFYQGLSISVRLSLPPYPSDTKTPIDKFPIIGVNDKMRKHIWLGDVMAGDKHYQCSGYDGMLGCVTARGSNVRECRRRVYRTIDSLVIPNVQYRTDIGKRVGEDFNKLKKWGWL